MRTIKISFKEKYTADLAGAFAQDGISKYRQNHKISYTMVFEIKMRKRPKLKKLTVAMLLLNPSPHKPWFIRVCSTSLLKTLWEKEKLLVMSNFSFSHSVFYPFGELPLILITFEIVICKLSVLKSLKFVVWERVKTEYLTY